MDFKGRFSPFSPAPTSLSCVAQAAPGLWAHPHRRAHPMQGMLLAGVLVLALVQGLLVEFRFSFRYSLVFRFVFRFVFRCVPTCFAGGRL